MPKCKICKQPFTPKHSTLEKTCRQYECMVEYALQVAKDPKNKVNAEKLEKKDWFERKKIAKVELYPRESKNELQREINKLSKLIDSKFPYKCICCGREYGKQTDAAHYNSVGSNSTIRFNLHNIHSASSFCNNYSNTHISGYYDGLIQRYGKEYADYVKYELPKTPTIKLLSNEIAEKTKITRELVRNFDTFIFKDGKEGREIFNKIIGIY